MMELVALASERLIYKPGQGPSHRPDDIYKPGQGPSHRPDDIYKPGEEKPCAPGCIPDKITSDDGDSQAQTSIQQLHNETQASATAQGTYQGGTAQSHVSGSYHGTGTFSASAGTIDEKRGAQTSISGGKDGTVSSAQGTGGAGQSQAQVQLASKTGAASSNAQTSGTNHASNTQVQANKKGGMADAQANAPGATSSQAQILFSPHDEDEAKLKVPFRGGGTASAQSTAYTGQSQSQLQGKFNQGIKYSGSAQAGTGSKDSVSSFRNKTRASFDFPSIFNNNSSKINLHEEETSTDEQIIITTDKNNDEYDEYDYTEDEDSDTKPKSMGAISQKSTSQRQHIILDPLEDLDANIVQSNTNNNYNGQILQPGQQIPGSPGYKIPQGFRGKISSIASNSKTYTTGPNSFAQSVTLSPGTGRFTYQSPVYAIASNSHRQAGYSFGSGYTYQPIQHQLKSGLNPPKFVSVTKSEAGSQNVLTGQRTPSVYYTQSSTCGFFTNTCVFSNGKKICLPKPRMNPDGTPIAC